MPYINTIANYANYRLAMHGAFIAWQYFAIIADKRLSGFQSRIPVEIN